jgi:hypothetical protein
MRFVSPHAGYKLVVIPTDYEWGRGNQRKTLKGLRVEFRNGYYDTEEAAQANGWTPDEREQVEQQMLQNADFGRKGGFYLVGSDVEEVGPAREVVDLDSDDALASLETMCAVTFQTPEGAVPCGNKAVGGSDYCRSHQRIAEKVGG